MSWLSGVLEQADGQLALCVLMLQQRQRKNDGRSTCRGRINQRIIIIFFPTRRANGYLL